MGKTKARKKRAKDVGNDVNADALLAAAVQRLQEILREHSEEEIRGMLLECNMNQNFAVNRLLSQQVAKNGQGACYQLPDSSTTTTSSVLVPNQSAITNGVTRNVPVSSTEAAPSLPVPSSSDVTNGETRSVPMSSTEPVPPLSVPSSSSCVANGETRSVPVSSNVAVPPLSVPSSSAITNGETRSAPIISNVTAPSVSVPPFRRAPTKVKPKRPDSRIISASDPSMADVLRGIHKKLPDATNRSSNSSTDSDAARRDHLQDSALVPINQPMATRQSTAATASSLGPASMSTHVNSFFSSTEFQQRGGSNSYTLAHDSNMMNAHYLWPPAQNNVPASEALQQRGGTNNNDTSLYQSLDSAFAQYRNDANSRFGYEDVSRIHLTSNSSGTSSSIGPSFHVNGSNTRLGYGDYLPPVHLQGSRSSNEWTVQSEEIYLLPSHWRSPGYRPTQQEQEAHFERIRADLASLSTDQENNTRDPSDQTQQRPRDK